MSERRIHLDHLVTTPLLPAAREAMRAVLDADCGVPSALHAGGLRARELLAQARVQVAGLLGAESPEEILFTSSGTEAANLAIKGMAWSPRRRGNHVVLSVAEHPAVLRSVEFLEAHGITATRVGVDSRGRVDPEAVRAALTEETMLICVHHAQHDIGTIQPVAEIGALAAERGIPLFMDATASGGWIPFDVRALPGSLVSLAPHRFYGPRGVGVLYRHRRARLASLIHGGSQEDGLRAGTENLVAIVGAGAAAEAARREMDKRGDEVRRLQSRLFQSLAALVDRVRLNGPEPGPTRHPVNLSLSIGGVEGEGLVLALDLQGVALHSGPACLTQSAKTAPVLEAIGLSPAQARSAINLSPGKDTTADEVQRAVALVAAAVTKLRNL